MFNSPLFTEAWELWKKHKQEMLGNPFTATAEERALSILFKESHGVEDLAIQSINESISNNWAKIYIVKNYSNGNGQTNGSTTSSNKGGTSTDRVEALRNW